MSGFSVPNDKPGRCAKCSGKGVVCWGAVVNGVPSRSGVCFACQGTGKQTGKDIMRNRTYNRHAIAAMVSSYR